MRGFWRLITLMMKTREEPKAELTGCAGTDWKPPAVRPWTVLVPSEHNYGVMCCSAKPAFRVNKVIHPT